MKRSLLRDESPVSFLSRLRGRGTTAIAPDDRFRSEVLAILRNLESILNTRKGTGCIVADYGLGDYDGRTASDGANGLRIGTKEILGVLVPEIEAQVRRFEPRIEDPSVEALGRDGRMGVIFGLRGAVSGRPVRFRVSLDTIYRAVHVDAQGEGLG